MPPYELHALPPETIMKDAGLSASQSALTRVGPNLIDYTGKRVKSYVDLVQLAFNLAAQRKHLSMGQDRLNYSFRPDKYKDNATFSRVSAVLNRNRLEGKLYHAAARFQRNAVDQWRGERDPALLLMLRILKDDETTSIGASRVILKFALRTKLIVLSSEKTGPKFVLGPDWDKTWVAMVGDGLTGVRFRQLVEAIDKKLHRFTDQYEQLLVFRQCLSRIVFSIGDLHGSSFHVLGPVYSLFYGGFLQVFKVAMGWKRIQHTKVEKTFEQCSLLALLVLEQCERQLLDAFVCTLSRGSKQELFECENDSESFAVRLAVSKSRI
jgi:hypothetical protein